MGVYCVYRVTNVDVKVSIMSILSIVSRLLATDWQQRTSLGRRLGRIIRFEPKVLIIFRTVSNHSSIVGKAA